MHPRKSPFAIGINPGGAGQMTWRKLTSGSASLPGVDSFPIYKQLPTDNSCGPRCILMVADYFEMERGRKLYAHEWSRVLEVTMKNDLTRDGGTSWEDMVCGLSAVGLSSSRFVAQLRSHPGGRCLALSNGIIL